MLVTADKARGCQGPGDPPTFQVRLIGVDAAYTGWGKAEAVCRFAETTGGRAAIGHLEAIPGLIAGTTGTQIDGRDPAVEYCG